MNSSELLRLVDTIHRDKNIPKSIVFEAIESALVSAAKKHYGEEAEIVVKIDPDSGDIAATNNGVPMDEEEVASLVGRIGAQTAKQVMIQKIREAERDSQFDEFNELKGQLMTGIVQRFEGGAAIVSLQKVEAILPRSEQIPGESHHPNERVRATICDVRKAGSRVKIILSRTRPELVQRLFEQEIPEIADGVIEIKSIAREAGYRTKVAVHSTDQRVDCVGACVGVRGNRIKNIVDELGGERIDIVRWNDSMQTLIPNALQPAEVEQVILCQMLGRAIVLVREDQLSLAIGKRGQNVRLASKLCVWDIEIMTQDELDAQIEQAVVGFSQLDGVSQDLAEKLVGEGYLNYDDLSVIEPDELMEMGGLTEEQVDAIVTQAETLAEEAEKAAADERRRQKELERQQAAAAAEAEAAATAEAEEAADAAEGEAEGSSEAAAEEESEVEAESDVPAEEDTAAEAEPEAEPESAEAEPESAEEPAEVPAEDPAEEETKNAP